MDVFAGPNAPAAEIVARIDRSHAAILVVDLATAPFGDTRDLRRLLAAARCTCVVLGASRAGSDAAQDG